MSTPMHGIQRKLRPTWPNLASAFSKRLPKNYNAEINFARCWPTENLFTNEFICSNTCYY